MATTRSQKASEAEESQDSAKVDQTPDATEKGLPKAEAPKDPTKGKKVIKVQNVHRRFFYIHPATGTRIGSGDIKELPQDDWIDMHIEAGILKEV